MKRDARIGLAVVLVLGLAVTLLIGRALYKDTEHLAAVEGENAATDAAVPYSGEVRRVEGAETSGITAAITASPVSNSVPGAAETAAHSPETNTAAQKFIEDQTTHNAGVAPKLAATPAEASKTAPANPKSAAGAKPALDPLLADHETTPPAPGKNSAGADHPVDGYAYTVVKDDNIWKISNKVYGDGKYTQKILEANSGLRADKMKVGSVIRIPIIPHKTVLMRLPTFAEATKSAPKAGGPDTAVAAKKPAPKEGAAVAAKDVKAVSAPAEAVTHKVEAGETLSAIAKKYYGVSGPKTIARIVAANKGLEPAKLKVGQELTIPPKAD